MNTKESVRLRKRKISHGYTSLYLDIYQNSKRSYEYLSLYLVPENNKTDKEKNKQTLQLAVAIKAKRIVEMQNKKFGFMNVYREDTLFYPYYVAMCEERKSKSSLSNWLSCLQHLKNYDNNEKLTFKDITPEWIQGFKEYLDNTVKRNTLKPCPLSRNSKAIYFNKLRTCINHAFEKRIIPYNPIHSVENFKLEEVTRMYLTIDELKQLAKTDMSYPELRRAFLFSCLTGLRRSDIMKLTWGEVHQQGEFTRLIFMQKKTGGQEYLDITQQAVKFMGKHGSPQDKIFPYMISPTSQNHILQTWVRDAGINKKITFHCGRHTFAVMMLDLGVDIYTVSKLLGHKELTTTQIYAKVLDRKKQEAVSLIPNLFF